MADRKRRRKGGRATPKGTRPQGTTPKGPSQFTVSDELAQRSHAEGWSQERFQAEVWREYVAAHGVEPRGTLAVDIPEGRAMELEVIIRGQRMTAHLPRGHNVRDGRHFYNAAVHAVCRNLDKVACWFCGEKAGKDDPDPCLGRIEGATDACCGHGQDEPPMCYPYVRWGDPKDAEGDDTMLDGDAALEWFGEHGIGPEAWLDKLSEDEWERWRDAHYMPEGWESMSEDERKAWEAAHPDERYRVTSQPDE